MMRRSLFVSALIALILSFIILQSPSVDAQEFELPMKVFQYFKISKITLINEKITKDCEYHIKIETDRVLQEKYGLAKVMEDFHSYFKKAGWKIAGHEDSRTSWGTKFTRGSRAVYVNYFLLDEESLELHPGGGKLEIYVK